MFRSSGTCLEQTLASTARIRLAPKNTGFADCVAHALPLRPSDSLCRNCLYQSGPPLGADPDVSSSPGASGERIPPWFGGPGAPGPPPLWRRARGDPRGPPDPLCTAHAHIPRRAAPHASKHAYAHICNPPFSCSPTYPYGPPCAPRSSMLDLMYPAFPDMVHPYKASTPLHVRTCVPLFSSANPWPEACEGGGGVAKLFFGIAEGAHRGLKGH